MKQLFVVMLSAGMLLTACDNDTKKSDPTPSGNYTQAISVGENGAAPYVLDEAQVGQATFQGPTANLVVSGRLKSGSIVRVTFSQSSPTTAGANTTDVVEVYSEKAGDATQASGRATRNPTLNTVSGTFTCRFANGTTLEGKLTNLQL